MHNDEKDLIESFVSFTLDIFSQSSFFMSQGDSVTAEEYNRILAFTLEKYIRFIK